jgi:hypothetical protein
MVSYLRRLLVSAFHFTRFVGSAAGVALTQLSEQDTLAVEDSINRFIASIVPVHQMGAVHTTDRHNLIVVHTLAQAALIRLYYLRAQVDQLWNEKCLLAARGMLLVIGQVSDMDIEFLDPIVGVGVLVPEILSIAYSRYRAAGHQLPTFSFVRWHRWTPGRRSRPMNLEATSGRSLPHCRG